MESMALKEIFDGRCLVGAVFALFIGGRQAHAAEQHAEESAPALR